MSYIIDNQIPIEEQRLKILNRVYAPITEKVLLPYLGVGKKVLELGCGIGEMAPWFAAHSSLYIGVDSSSKQIERARKHVLPAKNVVFIESDLFSLHSNDEFISRDLAGKFDLIYCRWLFCHIKAEQRKLFIKLILAWLSPGGIFICEDADYRSMALKLADEKLPSYEIEQWKKITQRLQDKGLIFLEYSPEKLQNTLLELIDAKSSVKVKILESFLGTLAGEDKASLLYGLETTGDTFVTQGIYEQAKLEDLKKKFEAIIHNQKMTVDFYLNTFVAVKKHT